MPTKKNITITQDTNGLRILVEVDRTFTTRRNVCNGFYKNGKPCIRHTSTCRFMVNDPSTHYCKIHRSFIPLLPPTCASDHVVYKVTASYYDDLLAGHCPVCQTKRTVCYTTDNPWCWEARHEHGGHCRQLNCVRVSVVAYQHSAKSPSTTTETNKNVIWIYVVFKYCQRHLDICWVYWSKFEIMLKRINSIYHYFLIF